MAQDGQVVNGQQTLQILPTASFFRFYHWNDRGHDTEYAHLDDVIQRRKLDIQKLDGAGFQYMVTLVAASGFFIDGYLLFANNFALPIIGYLYWPEERSSHYETSINCATLAGTIIGQSTFGIWADLKGRKKVYGYELLVVGISSAFIAVASAGLVPSGSPPQDGSMSIFALLVIFRFIIGIGVGAEYPLTAAITSEWAPAKHRGRMLAVVFSAQSLGQCVAAIVAYGALAGGRMSLDSVWRLIYGVPAVPALFAYVIRRTIPETPRYVYDVQRDAAKASDGVRYMLDPSDSNVNPANPEIEHPDDPLKIMPPERSWRDFLDYFFCPLGKWYSYDGEELWSLGRWTRFRFTGKWPLLSATSTTWLLLDLSFFGLGLNSSKIVTGLWKGCRNDENIPHLLPMAIWNSEPYIANSVTSLFEDNELAFWSVVSVGALLGSFILVLVARFVDRRKLTWISFLLLGILFIVIGGILWTEVMDHFSAPYFLVLIFYVICQFLFNFGPNAMTFILPAEYFPTRYRCSCLGISAAIGKLGSVIAQVSLLNIQFDALDSCQHTADTNLGKVLIGFSFAMLLGALISWFLPPVQYGSDKMNKTLEDLGSGPPPRPPPIADAEQGQSRDQQAGFVAPPPPPTQQQQQNTSPQPLRPGGYLQRRDHTNERPKSSHEVLPLPSFPSEHDRTPLTQTTRSRPRRKRAQAPATQLYSEEHEMEQLSQAGSSRASPGTKDR